MMLPLVASILLNEVLSQQQRKRMRTKLNKLGKLGRSSVVATIFAVGAAATALPAAAGYELVCKGSAPTSANKAIVVDCSDRAKVIDTLGAAWQEVRANRIGGSTEDMCWKPYQKAKEIHPSIPMTGIAPTFFAQCNMALQYAKTN